MREQNDSFDIPLISSRRRHRDPHVKTAISGHAQLPSHIPVQHRLIDHPRSDLVTENCRRASLLDDDRRSDPGSQEAPCRVDTRRNRGREYVDGREDTGARPDENVETGARTSRPIQRSMAHSSASPN